MSLIAISYPKISQSDFDWIQSLRKKYDKDGYRLLNLHFTLIFLIEKIKQEKFIDHIRPKIQNCHKIQFELNRFKLCSKPFERKWFIFLVPEKGKNEISKLHDILYSELLAPELSLDYPFDPHITIGCLEDKNRCLDIIEDLNKNDFSVYGQIDFIDAAAYENDIVMTIEKIKLK